MSDILKGVSPVIPPNCPEEIAAIMRVCWRINPAERPTFKETLAMLEAIQNDLESSNSGENSEMEEAINRALREISGSGHDVQQSSPPTTSTNESLKSTDSEDTA